MKISHVIWQSLHTLKLVRRVKCQLANDIIVRRRVTFHLVEIDSVYFGETEDPDSYISYLELMYMQIDAYTDYHIV